MPRIRLDKLLIKRNFADDSDAARDLIESGNILVNGSVQKSTASFVDTGDAIELLKVPSKYVSRGGLKLEKALDIFSINISGKRCLDVGASTGGFTDCMLDKGASHVVAIDVGKGQLDDKIRHHDQVDIYEKFNAKDLSIDAIGGTCEFAAMDVSFTSIIPLMPAISSVLSEQNIVALIKPQFEVGEKFVDVRGVVNDENVHIECVNTISQQLEPQLKIVALEYSPITGAKGNIEFIAHITSADSDQLAISRDRIEQCVRTAHTELGKAP